MTNEAPSTREQHLIQEAGEANITVNTTSIRLIAGGDVMIGRQMPGWVALHGSGWPFAGIAKLLETADLTLVNLETCVSTLGDFLDKGGRQPYYYHTPPDMLDVLSAANIHCVTTANNHAMDYGKEALLQQYEILDSSGFLHFGSGRDFTQAALPGYARINGLTIAFIGVETETPCMQAGIDSPGIHYASVQNLLHAIGTSISTARAHADIVIVTPHWGANWQETPTSLLRDVARSLIDLGADAVLGHSAHILQGLELHAGRPIVYDMGTLLFDRVAQSRMRDTALFELELDAQGVRQLTIHPVKLTAGQAHLAAGDDAERIRGLMIRLSHDLNPATQFEPIDEGLRVICTSSRLAIKDLKKKFPQKHFVQARRPKLPAPYRHLRSNLVYDTLPVDCHWDTPVIVSSELKILGARFATPVQPGRGFVCEVYFRVSPPPMPSRVEARLTVQTPNGEVAFTYTHPVAEGIHPPARWNLKEVICDRVVVRPGKPIAEGSYDLYWQLVDMEKRISMRAGGRHERLVAGKVFLGKLVVSQNAPNGVAGIAPPLQIDRIAPISPVVVLQASSPHCPEPRTRLSIDKVPTEQGIPKLATPANPLLLDIGSIARITSGTWHCLPDKTRLTGIAHNWKYMQEGSSGNLFFASNADARDHSFTEETAKCVIRAIRLGAVAAVVPHDAVSLPEGLPLLCVDNAMAALEALGTHVRDRLFTGKRVIVTGTEGKTGFKCMLHHVLSPQIPTHAILNSSNLDVSLYASLASIRQHDRIAILEAAGTHPGRCKRRSNIVKPHLFVITEVGNEHIMYHGSQQAVIEGKADIAVGLCDGGYGILNADSRNYAAVRKAVLSRRKVPLLLFGSTAECNGRLIDRHFENNGWNVSAEIEGEKVEYLLPLLGEHAPLASVSVLLAAHHLGADIARAAAEFANFVPYESQGVLRRITCHGGEALLFDNATRASVLSYQSALRTAARLAPPVSGGRKVAMIGQMIFLGDEAQGEHARLAEWVDEACFDSIILVGAHMEVTYTNLKNQAVVVKRFPSYDRRHSDKNGLQQLIDTLMEEIRPGDLVFVKGEVDEVGDYLRALEIKQPLAKPQPAVSNASTPPPRLIKRNDSSSLEGLQKISLDDLPRYKAAINQTRQTVWQSYFPFLYFLGQNSNTTFLIEEDTGSICIYRLRQQGERSDLCLFLLPMPFQLAVLERCLQRVRQYNDQAKASIFRIDAEDAGLFKDRPHTRIVSCPEEYIYAPSHYIDLSGGKNGNLRRNVNKFERRDDIEVADYRIDDQHECLAVIEQWETMQQDKYGELLYQGYTVNCLKQYELFPRSDLFGKVIRIGGEIRSFGFAGEMRNGFGNLFITKSDHRINGLNKYLNYCLLRAMKHLELVNSSNAGDTPGLAFSKQELGPVALHPLYQVYVRR